MESMVSLVMEKKAGYKYICICTDFWEYKQENVTEPISGEY